MVQAIELTDKEKAEVRKGAPYVRTKGKFDKRRFSGLVCLENAAELSGDSLLTIAETLEPFDDVEYCEKRFRKWLQC